MHVSGGTRTIGVIGWPVSHSLSPVIHNAAFRAMRMDRIYVPLPVPPGSVGEALEGLMALGFEGANVTMPHKTQVAERVDELSDDARVLNAVNTIVVGPAATVGHNTDVTGFDRFLRQDEGFDPAGRSVLIYGAGGAARACALALARSGAEAIVVSVRDASRADGVREAMDGYGTRLEVASLEGARDQRVDLIVNATPLGVAGEELPLPELGPGMLVVDLLYNPASTPLLEAARGAGAGAAGGLGLLLHQAALSFELWTGQVPPMDVMSAAALAALADRT
jgi:shikimate dehydrogenase